MTRVCTLLVEHYESDWDRLWWVRVDGVGVVDHSADALASATSLLAERHVRYRAEPPPGPVIVITVERLSGWAASTVNIATSKNRRDGRCGLGALPRRADRRLLAGFAGEGGPG